MIRVVLDTNILVSALLKPESLPASVLMLVLSGALQMCVTDEIFAEYSEVIRRRRLKLSAAAVEGTLSSVRRLASWVKPTTSIVECSDPDDNMFLECAVTGEADFLITGNRRHFPERYGKVHVIGARELMDLLIEQWGGS